VPFLAGGVARGAMAISHQATSYLNPSQNAAEEAAREASTGNVSLGNTSFENSSVMTRQFAQGSVAPSFTYGAQQTRTVSDSGAVTTSFGQASYDQLPNSSYPFTPTLGQEFTSRLSTMASQARANSESYANVAAESTSSAVSRFRELRDQFSNGSSFESASGTSNSDSIQTAFSEVDQASTNLQRQFGLSRRAADDISTAWFLGGEAGANAGLTNGVASAKVGLKGGGTKTWTDSDIGIASEDRSRIFGSLSQMSDSRNWSSTRDGFVRSVSTSSTSSVSTTASGMNASLTEAQSFTIEARRAEELANRLESQASFLEGSSAAGSLNLSQAYREWGLAEIEGNRDFYGPVRFDDVSFQVSPEGQALQAKFIESYAEQLRDGIDDRLVLTTGQPISRPAITGANSVRARAQIGGGVSVDVPHVDTVTIKDEVQRTQAGGRQMIVGPRSRLDAITKGAKGASAEAADDVKEW
jgi:conjugal transfer mating pair stabilization protein TraG